MFRLWNSFLAEIVKSVFKTANLLKENFTAKKAVCKPRRHSPWLWTKGGLIGNRFVFTGNTSPGSHPVHSVNGGPKLVKSRLADASRCRRVGFSALVCWGAVADLHQELVLLWGIDFILWFFQRRRICLRPPVNTRPSNSLAWPNPSSFLAWQDFGGEAEFTRFCLIFTRLITYPRAPFPVPKLEDNRLVQLWMGGAYALRCGRHSYKHSS